jgi:hypothetical protein
MSYEKYIKYKTKYLNLKAKLHNKNINNTDFSNNIFNKNEQVGGNNDFINTLGSTPNSEIYNTPNNNNLENVPSNNFIGGSRKIRKNVFSESDSSLLSFSSENTVSSSDSVSSSD